MEIQPKLKVTRFAQLELGELFLFQIDVAPSFGLKIIDPENDGDIFLLPLGPNFSQEPRQPRFYAEPAVTVISFGKDYIFKFSENPDGWSFEEPGQQFFCAALIEDQVHLRANGYAFPGRYVPCWIGLNGGVIRWGNAPRMSVFSVKWQILLPDGNLPPRLLLDQSGKPINA